MEFLGKFHPQIVHTPIAMLVFSACFAILGRLFDRDWLRKASVLMLVFGFLGAFAAVRSGLITHRVPEHDQGVPERQIDDHAEMGQYTLYVSGAALVAIAVGSRLSGGAAQAVGVLALLLQIAAAVCVGIAGKRGGDLVYDHGANVRIGGVLVRDVGGARPAGERDAPGRGAAADSVAAGANTGRDQDEDEKK
jgi:uncharacterized membrane protein